MEMILATDLSGCIGRGNALPWHLPSDFKWFKSKTIGKTILMGRKTWESLPIKPLPNRLNVVLSRCIKVPEFDELWFDQFDKVRTSQQDLILIGGATLYRTLLPYVNRVYLTKVHLNVVGDAYFNLSLLDGWKVTHHGTADDNGVFMEFLEYTR